MGSKEHCSFGVMGCGDGRAVGGVFVAEILATLIISFNIQSLCHRKVHKSRNDKGQEWGYRNAGMRAAECRYRNEGTGMQPQIWRNVADIAWRRMQKNCIYRAPSVRSFVHYHNQHCTKFHSFTHLSNVLVIHFLAGVATTILIMKIAVTQQQRLWNKA